MHPPPPGIATKWHVTKQLWSRGNFIHAPEVPQTSVPRPELQVPTIILGIMSAFHVHIASPSPEGPDTQLFCLVHPLHLFYKGHDDFSARFL